MRRYRRSEKERYYTDLRVPGRLPLLFRPPILRKVVNSLIWCCDKRGLRIFEYCIMPDRLVMIGDTAWGNYHQLIYSFMKFTSTDLIRLIGEGRHGMETLRFLSLVSDQDKTGEIFWQEPVIEGIPRGERIDQCALEVRNIPVRARYVNRPEHYLNCSAHPAHPLDGWIVESVDRWV